MLKLRQRSQINKQSGFTKYISDSRLEILRLLETLMQRIYMKDFKVDLLIKVVKLEFGEAYRLVSNILKTKRYSEKMGYIYLTIKEVLSHFKNNSPLSSIPTFTVKILEESYENLEEEVILRFIVIFFLQRRETLNNDFNNLPLLLKLVYTVLQTNNDTVEQAFSTLRKSSVEYGVLDGLLFAKEYSEALLSNYMNSESNLVLGYLLGALFCPQSVLRQRAEADLCDILNRLQMFEMRIKIISSVEGLAKDLSVPTMEKCSEGALLYCFFCWKPLLGEPSGKRSCNDLNNPKFDLVHHCGNPMPSCAICLSAVVEGEGVQFLWCPRCKHGGHSDHMNEWFSTFEDCPEKDCKCVCMKYNTLEV